MKARSFLPVIFVSLTFIGACGSKSDDKEETTTTSIYTYEADTKAIINASCATTTACHGTGSTVKAFTSLALIKAETPSKMITRIQSTDATLRMPQDDATFATSANGVILLDWLAGGADLK